jgi:hypothetical protein
MRFRALLVALLMLLICPLAKPQGDAIRLQVLAYQWTTTHKTMTFSWPGYADTSCSGNASISGYANGNNISATATSNSSCNTTFTPPSTQNIDIQRPVVFIVADSDTSRMILTCSRSVRWSQCHALNPGPFVARNDKGHFEVQAVSGKGKEEWIKFDVVQQTAISRPDPEKHTAANRSSNSTEGTPGAASPSGGPGIERPPSANSSENAGFPSRWKSMTTGMVRTLRFESNYIYGEVVLSDAAIKAGAFTLLELKKDGDKFKGQTNAKMVRQDGTASCPGQFPMELTLVTPERIEGRTMSPLPNAKVDWAKCSSSPGPEWQNFTWIPVK